jgi:flagellar motor switch protein FliN/FliY
MSPLTAAALETAAARLLPGLPRAAAALARSLPADAALTAGQIDDGAGGRERLLPAQPRCVSAGLSGAVHGTIALVVSGALAEAVEHGPVLTQELRAGLEPGLTDAVLALAETVDGDLRLEAPHEVEAEVALGSPADGSAFVAMALLDGGQHVATLALVLRGAPAFEGDPAEEASVEETIDFRPLVQSEPLSASGRSLDLLADVEMGVTAELGRTRMTVKDLLTMAPGSVIELDRTAGSPVDVLVNGTLVARGEVVVIDEEFAVRISEIIGLDQTARSRRQS